MGHLLTMRRSLIVAALSSAALVTGVSPAKSEAFAPKPGTYAGAGAMIDNNTFGMQVGLTLEGTTVNVAILGWGYPSCTGFTSVPAATLSGKRFTTSASNPGRDTLLKGRWVKPRKVRGRMVLTVPPTTNCGTPGTYAYRYAAGRYGGL
jgi:hypothetical protein